MMSQSAITKKSNGAKALDDELRDIAHKATMKALRTKLADAEKIAKTAEAKLARSRALRRGHIRRVEDLHKQEVQDSRAVVRAQQLIDDLKQKLAEHDVRRDIK